MTGVDVGSYLVGGGNINVGCNLLLGEFERLLHALGLHKAAQGAVEA